MQPSAVLVSLHLESSTSCRSSPSAEADREGLARDDRVNDNFGTLRAEIQQLRSDMSALAWRLFAALVTVVTAATAGIMTAIAVWG